MDVLGQFIDGRRGQPGREDPALIAWIARGKAPAERLLAFDRWVAATLQERLQWPADPARRTKLIGQCRAQLETIVLDLWRRQWMLDGRLLAKHILAAIDDVAAAQKAGRVQDFWPFFKSVCARHVGVNAEEIQREAMSAGSLVQQTLGALLRNRPGSADPTIPELVAQRRAEIASAKTLREKLTTARKAARASEWQLPLL